MSVKLSAYVWDGCAAAGMKTAKIAIMARLADFSNDDGVCWPSVNTIARQIGAGVSTVRTALGELERDGWIFKKTRRQGNRNASNVYQLNVKKLKAAAQASESDPSESERSKFDGSKSDASKSDRSEFSKNNSFDPPDSGGDPLVSSKEDPSYKKPVGRLDEPTDAQQSEKLKIDYQAVLAAYHEILPEMPKVLDMTTDRQTKLRTIWKKFKFDQDRWSAYLQYIAKHCRWMLENRPDTGTGKTWRKKNFDYLITERCYLAVKEERANDLPQVARVDTTARDSALVRLISQGRKPANEIERLAQIAGQRAGLGRMNEVVARNAWKGIWASAVEQASENDLRGLA